MDHELLRKLHAMLGSDSANEAEAARAKIKEILAEAGKTWNDLQALLAESAEANTNKRRPGDKGAKGYLRKQFESAWAAYCEPVTPSQSAGSAFADG
jgi:hypothetical protein